MAELSIFLHQNYPLIFIVLGTIFFTSLFNKFIATKPWVRHQIGAFQSISEKQIMQIRLSHEELATKVAELAKINVDVAKQSESFQASFKMFMDMQNKKE